MNKRQKKKANKKRMVIHKIARIDDKVNMGSLLVDADGVIYWKLQPDEIKIC